MTNQEYMDILEKFATGGDTYLLRVSGSDGDLIIEHSVDTDYYHIPNSRITNTTIIRIVDGLLQMYMPNIMDLYIGGKTNIDEIRHVAMSNVRLMREGTYPTQVDGIWMGLHYYEDEAERFQRELMGEFVLYETHLKYVHQIVQRCHDVYRKTMQETWDKCIKL